MRGRAGARWQRCDTAALRCDTAGGLGHDTARPPTTRPRACGLSLRLGQLGQVGVLCTLTQFLDPVRLDIFPESLNEHCSL